MEDESKVRLKDGINGDEGAHQSVIEQEDNGVGTIELWVRSAVDLKLLTTRNSAERVATKIERGKQLGLAK